MRRSMRATAGCAFVGLIVATTGCGDSEATSLLAPDGSVPPLAGSATWDQAFQPPTCNGLTATIWAGMDPSLVPQHAVVERLEDETDHDDPDSGHEPGHDGTAGEGCGGHDGEDHDGEDHDGGEPEARPGGRWLIIGTPGPDVIVGGRGPDRIEARNGADVVCGLSGPDEILGGNGDDALFGGRSPDLILGERGDDHLDGGRSPDEIHGGSGNDLLLGRWGSDLLYGGPGDDALYGHVGIDVLEDDQGVNILDPGPQECGGGSGSGGGDHSHE